MPKLTIPGVQSITDCTMLSNPTLAPGDIVLIENGVSTNLPFAFREAGQPPIDITLTDEQLVSRGVLVVRDQTNPPEWDGPNPKAGPFTDCLRDRDEIKVTVTASDVPGESRTAKHEVQ